MFQLNRLFMSHLLGNRLRRRLRRVRRRLRGIVVGNASRFIVRTRHRRTRKLVRRRLIIIFGCLRRVVVVIVGCLRRVIVVVVGRLRRVVVVVLDRLNIRAPTAWRIYQGIHDLVRHVGGGGRALRVDGILSFVHYLV